MKIVILPSANRDLATGFVFYENQEAGLGRHFRESLISDIGFATGLWRDTSKSLRYHRLLSRRFPYAVYYSLDGETVFIRAVLDCRQDPERARRKLEN